MAKKVKKAATKSSRGGSAFGRKKAPVGKVATWIHVEEEIIIAGGGLLVILMIMIFLF